MKDTPKNPAQLMAWIKNESNRTNIEANSFLQFFMMERFLERVSLSEYRENVILKGGFLIAAMLGIDMRTTMDIDTTIKGMPVNQDEIQKMVTEITEIVVEDGVVFEFSTIKPIRHAAGYEDFRVGMIAKFFTMTVPIKLDITTGDTIIPREIMFPYKLMFDDREIMVMTYNLNTVLAEKIESILARNVANTRARDYYDVYVLLTVKRDELNLPDLRNAIKEKAIERGTEIYINQHEKYLMDIEQSVDLREIWEAYAKKYPYAAQVVFDDIINVLRSVFES